MKAVPEAAVGAVAETLRDQGLPAPVAGGGMTFLQARTANEVLKAQKNRLLVEKLKGQLVDVAQVRAKVFRFAREQRDSWLNWPNRVAAIIAAEYEIDNAAPFHATSRPVAMTGDQPEADMFPSLREALRVGDGKACKAIFRTRRLRS
jgi:hypothetical protein